MPPARRIRRWSLAFVALPIASALLVEFGSRLLDRWRGTPWDPVTERTAIERIVRSFAEPRVLPHEKLGAPVDDEPDRPREAQVIHPYTGWDYPSKQKRIADDVEYYRRPEAEANFDVCILGGSVADYFSVEGGKRLAELMKQDPHLRGREIRIHDYASAGDKQFQPLMLLSFLLGIGHKPDAVVELDGFNEAALGWHNAKLGAHPSYPYLLFWSDATSGLRTDWEVVGYLSAIRSSQDRAARFGEGLLRYGVWRSSFLGHLGQARLESLGRDCWGAYESYSRFLERRTESGGNRGPRYSTDDAAIVEAIVACWVSGSESLHGICAERGIVYLHVLQPTLHDEGSKTLTRREIQLGAANPAWIEGVRRVYPRLREAGARLAARGFPFFDASGIFRECKEDIYYDACHVVPRGNALLAEAVAPHLLRAAGW